MLVMINLLLSCSLILSSLVSMQSKSKSKVRLGELTLRKIAERAVMPSFPEESKKQAAKGIAVAEIEIDEGGDVVQVEVVEAPDQHIRKAVSDAVLQWKFKPTSMRSATGGSLPVLVRGKLTFYYVIDQKGESRVENPRRVQ